MNELSQEALYNLIYSALSFTDTLFQVWLTVTFAAILAIYFSRDEISKLMRFPLLFLYAGTSILLTGRWVVGIIHAVRYQEMLFQNGFTPFPTPPAFGASLAALHFSMFIVGTLATIYFMFSFKKDSRSSENDLFTPGEGQ